MFDKARNWVRSITDPAPRTVKLPHDLRYRCWVVLKDGQVGYIDHYKSDGKFGVRPIDEKTGEHLINSSEHWSMEDRQRIPEEYALALKDFRAAENTEIPVMHRRV